LSRLLLQLAVNCSDRLLAHWRALVKSKCGI
jgi:hypothetical protein